MLTSLAPITATCRCTAVHLRIGADPVVQLYCHCNDCQTYLFAEVAAAGGLRSVSAYVLPPGAFQPQMHVQCQHALLPVVDALPHFKAFPAAFGGSDEQVQW